MKEEVLGGVARALPTGVPQSRRRGRRVPQPDAGAAQADRPIQLQRLRARLAERKIEIELTDAALDHFARTGYDPVYGARPLKRLLQKELETSLGRKLLAGEVHDNSRVVVDYRGDDLTFTSTPLAEAA